MIVDFQCGDSITIPEGCKAIVKDNEIVFKKDENEFKDGDILHSVFDNTMVIFKSTQDKDFFYTRYNTECLEDEDWRINYFRLATEEEKQLLFDKMKEQGLRWNAKEKRVEKIRWRAGVGEEYYFINSSLDVLKIEECWSISSVTSSIQPATTSAPKSNQKKPQSV